MLPYLIILHSAAFVGRLAALSRAVSLEQHCIFWHSGRARKQSEVTFLVKLLLWLLEGLVQTPMQEPRWRSLPNVYW